MSDVILQHNDKGEIEAIFDSNGLGCRIRYQDNILNCTLHPTGEENFKTAKAALTLLLGFLPTDEQIFAENGRVEFFKSYGEGY